MKKNLVQTATEVLKPETKVSGVVPAQSQNIQRQSVNDVTVIFFFDTDDIVVVLPECNALDEARHDKQQNILATVLPSCNKMIQNLQNSAKFSTKIFNILLLCFPVDVKLTFFKKKGSEE